MTENIVGSFLTIYWTFQAGFYYEKFAASSKINLPCFYTYKQISKCFKEQIPIVARALLCGLIRWCSQPAITFSKLIMEILEQGVKFVQS